MENGREEGSVLKQHLSEAHMCIDLACLSSMHDGEWAGELHFQNEFATHTN